MNQRALELYTQLASRFTPLEQAALAADLKAYGAEVLPKLIAKFAESAETQRAAVERAKQMKQQSP
jgi:hypothetical protein